jgi:hypothetical protein
VVGPILAEELTEYATGGRRLPRDGLSESVVRAVLRQRDPEGGPKPRWMLLGR